MELNSFSVIAQIFSAISLGAGAAAAWGTFYFYHRKTRDQNWLEAFRRLYAEFWNDNEAATVRKWLVNEGSYEALAVILDKRLAEDKNTLSPVEYDSIEAIDRFCALMLRIIYFGHREMDEDQRDLYREVFRHWAVAMLNRPQVARYLEKYWNPLFDLLRAQSL